MSDPSPQEKRLAMIEGLIAKGSTDPFHYYARAMELRSLGKTDAALTAYEEVRDKFPNYVPVYLMAGQVLLELGRNDDARGWLTEGVAKAEKASDHHALSELQAALDTIE